MSSGIDYFSDGKVFSQKALLKNLYKWNFQKQHSHAEFAEVVPNSNPHFI